MHILHIIDKLSMDGHHPSSCAILLRQWADEFQKRGIRLSICTLRDPDPGSAIFEKSGTNVFCIGHGKMSWKNIVGVTEIVNSERPHILHLHGYSAANFGRIVSRRKRIPNVVHEHAVLKVLPHQYTVDFLLQRLTDAAVAVSNSVKQFMRKGRCIPENKIKIIANGIKIDQFERKSEAEIAKKRKELNISKDRIIIGTVTRLREEKGTEYLIRAIPAIIEEFPKIILLVVGDGPLRVKLNDLAKELGVKDYVRFLGFRSDIAEILSTFKINVIPSLSEGFGLALVEAMAMKTAIIATEVGGMQDILKKGEIALSVAPMNSKNISEKVRLLLNNPSLAEKLSRNAEKLSRHYDIKQNVNALKKLYIDVLNFHKKVE